MCDNSLVLLKNEIEGKQLMRTQIYFMCQKTRKKLSLMLKCAWARKKREKTATTVINIRFSVLIRISNKKSSLLV